MRIAVLKETAPGETRVALVPESVGRLTKAGHEVVVERGAGVSASAPDTAYEKAGAQLADGATAATTGADLVAKVQRPSDAEYAALPEGCALVCLANPATAASALGALNARRISVFALELVPRITRAQSMDVLSSQSTVAGYKAVLIGANALGKFLPMLTTAAGSVPPAKVFVIGAGVAGLQAIATARRLGAQVTATDVRPAAKEQVASLGAKFIAVEDDEFKQAQTAAGYAKPMSAEYQAKQAELVAAHIKNQDIVVTTALIPGRPAPRLITRAMVESMKPGSVIVDLAAERGGNCELTQPDQTIDHNGVRIFGPLNLAGEIAVNASSLYAKNLYAFLETLIDKKEKTLAVNWDDEIVKGTLLAREGKIVHPSLQGA
jgi:NAD(P) transhydrogenase subunit alpha